MKHLYVNILVNTIKERSIMIRRSALLLALIAAFVTVSTSETYAKTQSPLQKKVKEVWGKKRGIKVIEHRVFEKNKRWEFGLFAGSMPNDEVWNYWPVGARIDYFVFESLGIELVGAYVPSNSTKLFSFLDNNSYLHKLGNMERLVYYAGINGFWAPIHGKFSAFNHEVTHFDVGLNFGAGVMGTKIKNSANDDWKMAKPTIYGEIGLGVQIYLSKSWALRLDYRHYFYKAVRFNSDGSYDRKGGTSMPAEFSIGFGWFTAAPK